jgi:signal transduction histidine kinase
MTPSVLIVEDERIVAMALEDEIKRLGYKVLGPASSTIEALQCCEVAAPDLGLMDIRIHGSTDGIECAQALRNRFDVPIIYLTAIADAVTIERAKLTEPAGYLVKPIRSEELKAAVEIALFKSQMGRILEQQRAEFIAMLIHDIRNPLQAIAGFAEILTHDLIASDLTRAQELSKRMHESITHTIKLIADQLSLLSPDIKHGEETAVRLSINEIISRIQERYVGEAMSRNIDLVANLAEDLPTIETDPLKLQRIFANLLFNALKFTPPGGRVTVSSDMRGNEILVSVTDTDKGWRGDALAEEEGSGMGLYVVKTLALTLGGRVEVNSKVGSGSCFSLFLPLTGAAIAAPGASTPTRQ